MGKCKKPTTTQLGWEPYVYGNGNTVCTYDPYRQTLQCGPPTQQQYNLQQQQMSTRSGAGASPAEDLDKMTRSRNALIIALIVFVAFGLACFIAVMVLAFPKGIATTTTTTTTAATTTTAVNTVDIQVKSEIVDSFYDTIDEDDLLITGSFSYKALQKVFCVKKIKPAVDKVRTTNSCMCSLLTKNAVTPISFTGTCKVNVNLDGQTAETRMAAIATQVVADAVAASDWTAVEADITLVP